MKRRTLLKASLQLGLTGTVFPQAVFGAYPTKAFLAKEMPEVLRAVFGTADIGESNQIEIEAPHIASDANMVPIRIKSGLENTESNPLLSEIELPFSAVGGYLGGKSAKV